ncbi:MAG: hypothetical protein ACE5LC_08230 [Candidatus Aminicenantales bacterium]
MKIALYGKNLNFHAQKDRNITFWTKECYYESLGAGKLFFTAAGNRYIDLDDPCALNNHCPLNLLMIIYLEQPLLIGKMGSLTLMKP